MTAEPPKIDYEALAQKAMRGLVRSVLEQTASSGLPGEHHFYISFDTCADQVSISRRLKEKYPTEMTIVLQHRFWDLLVHDDYFEVKLTFDGIPERLVVPFSTIKVFFDPSVRYGLQFEDPAAVAANSDPDFDTRADGSLTGTAVETSPIVSELIQRAGDVSDQSSTPIDASIDTSSLNGTESSDEAAGEAAGDAGENEFSEEPTVLDTDQVASATEGAKILRLDAFRKKQT